MGWFSRKVRVTLINDATGETFARTEMNPDDLPESFAKETTLHLGSEDWSVIEATPQTRAEYAKSRTLTVRLRRIEKVDISKILFSLPTISDHIEGDSEAPPQGDELVLIEDDWRQFELVSSSQSDVIESEIQAVRKIHDTQRQGPGFRKLHLRQKLYPPIVTPLTLADIDAAFGNVLTFVGVRFDRHQFPVKTAFAFKTSGGLLCYGMLNGEAVYVLALAPESKPSPADADAMVRLAKQKEMTLVHWCGCASATADDPFFRELLTGN